MRNGKSSNRYCSNRNQEPMDVVGRGKMIEKFSTASSGYCDQVHAGRICPNAFRRTRLAIDDSSIGLTPERSDKYWKRWPTTCESEANWTWRNALSTAPL
jgi:hypothetical protein